MGLYDDVHLGLCLGLYIYVRHLIKQPQLGPDGAIRLTPYLVCLVVGVPLVAYGNSPGHYLTVLAAAFLAYRAIARAEEVWAACQGRLAAIGQSSWEWLTQLQEDDNEVDEQHEKATKKSGDTSNSVVHSTM